MTHQSLVPDLTAILSGMNSSVVTPCRTLSMAHSLPFNLAEDVLQMSNYSQSDFNIIAKEDVVSASLVTDCVNSDDNDSKKDSSQSQKPKRPLSAYNFFFHQERQLILNQMPTRVEGKPRRSHGKIGFADLARNIASKWKSLSDGERKPFDDKAAADKDRYIQEMNEWKKTQLLEVTQAAASIGPNFHQLNGARSNVISSGGIGSSYYSASALEQSDKPINGLSRNNTFSCEPVKYANLGTSLLNRQGSERAFTVAEVFALNRSKLLQCRIDTALNSINISTEDGGKVEGLCNSIFQGVGIASNSIISMNRMSTALQLSEDAMSLEPNRPRPISPVHISELAQQLDDESTQLLLNIFR